jgi:hypothetical protein
VVDPILLHLNIDGMKILPSKLAMQHHNTIKNWSIVDNLTIFDQFSMLSVNFNSMNYTNYEVHQRHRRKMEVMPFFTSGDQLCLGGSLL